MNILPFDKQIQIVAALTEGCSIRSIERLTNTHRDTVMRLGVRVGEGCAALHDRLFQNLNVPLIEMDEIWSFIGKKQRKLTPEDSPEFGDCYIFTAMSATHKTILAYRIGKRTVENCFELCDDLACRVLNRPQITTDGWPPYVDAIERTFGGDANYGQIIKSYSGETTNTTSHRYSPGVVVNVRKEVLRGNPDKSKISTSYIERSNLTMRMQSRRMTRLTNAFSKKLENHKAAIALFVANYNFCHVHETLRTTPAMALGLTDHIWTIGELVMNALDTENEITNAA